MEAFQQRVIDEQVELGVKLDALSRFIDGASAIYIALPLQEKSRLTRQRNAMRDYYNVLEERIAAFK